MKYIKLVQLALLLFFLPNLAEAQWVSHYTQIQSPDSLPFISEISFSDRQNGIAACGNHVPNLTPNTFNGSSITTTADSGKTWTKRLVLDSIGFSDVVHLNSNVAIAIGSGFPNMNKGVIARTIDSGFSWDTTWLNFYPILIEKINDSTLIVSTKKDSGLFQLSNFLLSNDFGQSWQFLHSNLPDQEASKMNFISDSIGFMTTIYGNVFRTENQGRFWDTVKLDSTVLGDAYSISSPDQSKLYMLTINIASYIYFSPDTGLTWSLISVIPGNLEFRRLEFITDSIGILVGDLITMKTVDAGQSWFPTSFSSFTRAPYSYLQALFMVDENYMYLGGDRMFFRTSNGGGGPLPTTINLTQFNKINHRLYPNPTGGMVNILNVEDLERVEVYDLRGRILQNFVILSDGRSVTEIDLTNFESGIYFLKLYNENGEVVTKKVVKE
ncbi:MAG: photosystem II stability/assembly factor-like uncharacterized protein [Vicingaceae bacterium]|jgi:photosystem II stability/assembly factor-like uncharacterized protein